MPDNKQPPARRGFIKWLAGATAVLGAQQTVRAHHTETHFDDDAKHKMVYQCNKADIDYLQHITFSVGELLRKHGDDIELVVTTFGPGIHILGKNPGRPIPAILQSRVSSLAAYGVAFHACGNTMKSLGWEQDDLLPFAKIVPIGVDDLMQLQARGFGYISW